MMYATPSDITKKFTDIVKTEARISQPLQIMKKKITLFMAMGQRKKIVCFLYASHWPMETNKTAKCSTIHFTPKRIKLLDQKSFINKF